MKRIVDTADIHHDDWLWRGERIMMRQKQGRGG
jgi:hypothetical protein